MCRRSCAQSRGTAGIAEVPAASADNLDPLAALRQLALDLQAAYRADPANATLARELRSTLLSLAPRRDDGVDIEWAALMREMSTPVPAEETDRYDVG